VTRDNAIALSSITLPVKREDRCCRPETREINGCPLPHAIMPSTVNRRPAYKLVPTRRRMVAVPELHTNHPCFAVGHLTVLSAFRCPGLARWIPTRSRRNVGTKGETSRQYSYYCDPHQSADIVGSLTRECPCGDSIRRTVDDSRRNPLMDTTDCGRPARIPPPYRPSSVEIGDRILFRPLQQPR